MGDASKPDTQDGESSYTFLRHLRIDQGRSNEVESCHYATSIDLTRNRRSHWRRRQETEKGEGDFEVDHKEGQKGEGVHSEGEVTFDATAVPANWGSEPRLDYLRRRYARMSVLATGASVGPRGRTVVPTKSRFCSPRFYWVSTCTDTDESSKQQRGCPLGTDCTCSFRHSQTEIPTLTVHLKICQACDHCQRHER
jgi:hypothetical protein